MHIPNVDGIIITPSKAPPIGTEYEIVCVLNTKTGKERTLVEDIAPATVPPPTWFPDGRSLLVLGIPQSAKRSADKVPSTVYRVDLSTGAVTRLGKVDDNTSVSDFDPEEQRRKISINTSLIPCEWNGYKINLLQCRPLQVAGEGVVTELPEKINSPSVLCRPKGRTRSSSGCVTPVSEIKMS